MKEHGQWVELAGHDFVLDLIADLELPPEFPKQKSYFIISSDNPAKVRPNASLSVCRIQAYTLSWTVRSTADSNSLRKLSSSLLSGLYLAAALTQMKSLLPPFLSTAADLRIVCLTLMVTTATVHTQIHTH